MLQRLLMLSNALDITKRDRNERETPFEKAYRYRFFSACQLVEPKRFQRYNHAAAVIQKQWRAYKNI